MSLSGDLLEVITQHQPHILHCGINRQNVHNRANATGHFLDAWEILVHHTQIRDQLDAWIPASQARGIIEIPTKSLSLSL